MIVFEVLINGTWTEAEYGIQCKNSRLAYWMKDGSRNIVCSQKWRISEKTKKCPKFRRACVRGAIEVKDSCRL